MHICTYPYICVYFYLDIDMDMDREMDMDTGTFMDISYKCSYTCTQSHAYTQSCTHTYMHSAYLHICIHMYKTYTYPYSCAYAYANAMKYLLPLEHGLQSSELGALLLRSATAGSLQSKCRLEGPFSSKLMGLLRQDARYEVQLTLEERGGQIMQSWPPSRTTA